MIGSTLHERAEAILARDGKSLEAASYEEYAAALEEAQSEAPSAKAIEDRAWEIAERVGGGTVRGDDVIRGRALAAEELAAPQYDPDRNRPMTAGRMRMIQSQVVHAQALKIANERGVLVDDLDSDALRALYEQADRELGGLLYGKAA